MPEKSPSSFRMTSPASPVALSKAESSPKWQRFAHALRLDEPDILVEQLRLIHASMNISIAPMFLAMMLLVVVLNDGQNLPQLLLWFVCLSASNANIIWDAHQKLKNGVTPAQAPQAVAKLMLCVAIGGFLWGALAWVVLGNTTLGGNVLIVGVLAGVLGGAVSLLSPVLPIFAFLAIPMVGTTVLHLWQLDDPAFNAFGFISVMYLGVLVVQCRNASHSVRAAINLRFENLELAKRAESARQEAVNANTAKSRFLAAASHDLRQPIHAQGLFLEVLRSTPLNAEQRELLDSACQSRESTAEMLNVLLDFSRIEAGVVEPHPQPFRMQMLLNKMEREFGPQADAKGLQYRSRETPCTVVSDPSLVELVLRNFISNAIRYTEQGGLLVTCRLRGDKALLEVCDTGIGIAPDQQREVFREFHQLANPERDSRKGLGLGLAISDGLARMLGHPLKLASRLGRGSVFGLILPIAPVPTVAAAVAAPAAATVAKAAALQSGRDPQAAPAHEAQASLNQLRVLLIDDEASVRAGMHRLLASWGCNCLGVETIEEALAGASAFNPDILISDYRLREQRTGAQAIVALRSHLGRALPCIIITGDTAPDRLREALASGVPLLHKPVELKALRAALVVAAGGRT